jgi:cytochrome P450
MSAVASRNVLRPGPGGLKQAVTARVMERLPLVFRVARAAWPIPHFGNTVIATRYDDVREVFLTDDAFGVPYRPKLDVIMGGQPFFLGMGDTPEYRADTEAMRKVIRTTDIPTRLTRAVESAADKIVANAGGRLEVVDALVRRVTFDVLGEYFGIPDPPNGDLRVWATRLFEFQFADMGNDAALRADVDEIAPALRQHIQTQIEQRRASRLAQDDVLGRCLGLQAKGELGFSDNQIRTALMGFVVGGPPQPPMVVPQALEQLLRRPQALAEAQEAARSGDDKLLAGYVFEAMRFAPLAPALPRIALKDCTIAEGTGRARKVPKGATVLAAFSSAMMDERRVAQPRSFNPRRLPHEYIHFGYGLHTCFGIHMNKVLLPLMLKSLLKRPGLRRAPGPAGRLRKRGAFADQLHVVYD